MKNKLKSLIVMLILVTIISLSGYVNAFSANLNLTSSSKLKAGDIVVVTLKIVSLDAGEGIDGIQAALEYSKDVFEEVTEDNIEGSNRWRMNGYSETSQIFTMTRSSKVNEASDILTISLKVKDDLAADVESTEITLKDIKVSGGGINEGGTGDINVTPVKVTITKDTGSGSGSGSGSETTTNEIPGTNTDAGQNNGGNNGGTRTNTTPKTNTGAATGRIPQTGENAIQIAAGIVIVAVVATVAYIKYRNIKLK